MAEQGTAGDLELQRIELERYKANLDFRKFVLGSVFAAIAIAAIPPSFQLATAVLEYVRHEGDRAVKQQEFRDGYIKEFLANALNQDIELRIRFAEYFAHVSDEKYRASWSAYRKSLREAREHIRLRIDSMEADWQRTARVPARNQVELDRIARNLAWAYKEVGYVEGNRSVALDPRAPTTQVQTAAPADAEPSAGRSAKYVFGGDRSKFYSKLKSSLLPGMTASQEEGLGVILDYWAAKYANEDSRMLAYILATAFYETNRTLRPMEEIGKGKGRPYGAPEPNGNVYYGRGFVQITRAMNYMKVGQLIGINLYDNPDLALSPNNSAAILVETMMRGVFTSKKLPDYFDGDREDWINARRIISGLQGSDVVAGFAAKFFEALQAT